MTWDIQHALGPTSSWDHRCNTFLWLRSTLSQNGGLYDQQLEHYRLIMLYTWVWEHLSLTSRSGSLTEQSQESERLIRSTNETLMTLLYWKLSLCCGIYVIKLFFFCYYFKRISNKPRLTLLTSWNLFAFILLYPLSNGKPISQST